MQPTKGFALIPMLVVLHVLALIYVAVLENWQLSSQALQQMQTYLQQQERAQLCIQEAICTLPRVSSCLSRQSLVAEDLTKGTQYWELEIFTPATRVFVRRTADGATSTILGWQTGGGLF